MLLRSEILYNNSNLDVSNLQVLQEMAHSVNWDIDVKHLVEDKSHPARQILMDNTKEVVERGGFGVPRC